MRNVLLSLSVATTCTVLGSADLIACGDKYLRLATRLGPGYIAEHRATVLIYMPPDSVVPGAAKSLKLQQTLKRAGHHVYVVERETELQTSLTTRRYDIVIADGSTAAALRPTLLRAAGSPTLLPIFHREQSKGELAAARTQLGCLIAAREKASYAVAEIDHVMQLRKAAVVAP